LGTRSAASRFCASSDCVRVLQLRLLAFLAGLIFALSGVATAQLTTGSLQGTLRTADGRPIPGQSITITGAGINLVVRTGQAGDFSVTLPYGRYQIAGAEIRVTPLEIARVALVMESATVLRVVDAGRPEAPRFPEPFSFQGVLASRDPSTITAPLNFTGLSDNRLAVASQHALSWTGTTYKLEGMDATDSYQPGFARIVPDVEALEAVTIRSAFTQSTSSSYAMEAGVYLPQPSASWHGAVSTANASSALASTNLPPAAERGLVQQPDRFQWLTRDHAETGGPLGARVDLFASATGQWASQTEPLAPPGTDQRSRMLFGNARGRFRAGANDRFDSFYSGSRIDLSTGGIPAGLEAFSGNRLAPSFVLPGGFLGQPEVDHLDFVQVGWTHLLPAARGGGAIEVRYQYSIAHLDTNIPTGGQSRVELLGGAVSGAPPLGNLAVRPSLQFAGSYQPALLRAAGTRHQLVAGGDWKRSEPRNRFGVPSNRDLITADGSAAFVMQFDTPVDSRELVRSFSGYFADHVELGHSLAADLAAVVDNSRGSVPAFTMANSTIAWTSLSPRAGISWQVPHSHGLVVRGAYSRLYAPLAGRYFDFGNPESLGGNVYQWISSDPNLPFQANEQGPLLARFGGPYSSISPTLGRPYADTFDVGADLRFAPRSNASIHLFRRDDKNRIAAIDTGVSAQAFTPVSIPDPGPDGTPGTFDDRSLTVYAQNPSTLGQDRYLLTNPRDLRFLNAGLVAELGTGWRGLVLHASFVAEKTYGPTDPGDAFYENDPGVVGSLFLDPNTAINAANRSFMDRAFVGKAQASYRLPAAWGGLELSTVADYTDGLVFARQILVTGLAQGPFLVAATVRGSPEGGNRAQYAINWNLRIARNFELPFGRLGVWAEILNVTNAGQSLQQNDMSGPSFNLRLPVSVEPPRFVRLGFGYEF
jgi:hypothetical protein